MEKSVVERYQKMLIGNADHAALLLARVDPHLSRFQVHLTKDGIKHFQWESIQFVTGEFYSLLASPSYHPSLGLSYEEYEAVRQYRHSYCYHRETHKVDERLEAALDQYCAWERALQTEAQVRIDHASTIVYGLSRSFNNLWPITFDELISYADRVGITTDWNVPKQELSAQTKPPGGRGPEEFYQQLERLLKEIIAEGARQGVSITRSSMPGTKADLHTLFAKCFARHGDLAYSSFETYLKKSGMTFGRKGKKQRNFYVNLFADRGFPDLG